MSVRARTARKLVLLAGAACLMAGPAAFAAEVTGADETVAEASAGEQAQDNTVGELIVTARRREESAQAVPIALQVTTGEKLDKAGVNNITQLTQLVPTLQVLSPNGRNTALTIRGLGASYGLANDGLEKGVGIYIDGVYNSRPGSALSDFIDVERVEVLRGPQGTLFGKNTTAGALNITTRDARTDAYEVQAEGSYGSYNFRQFKGSVSGPIIKDVLAFRLSAVGTYRDGDIYNPVQKKDQNARESETYRGQLLWQANPDLLLRLNVDYTTQQPECCTQLYWKVAPTLKPLNQQYAALAAGRGYAPASTNIHDRLADVDSEIQADQRLFGYALTADYDFGWSTLTVIGAHREWDWEPRNDRDYTALDVTRQSANPSIQKQDSLEIRLASNGSNRIDWTAGLYYFDQNITTTGVTQYGADASYWLLPGTGSPDALLDGYTVFNNSTIDTTSYAAFGQLTWNITDKLRVTPGIRYTQEEKQGEYVATVSGGLVTANTTLINRRLGIARPQAYEASTDDGSWSGQIAVSYDITDKIHLYGTYSQGFKSGGINMSGIPNTASGAPSLVNAVVEPEEVTTYEAGLKTQLFDDLLVFNVAVFATDVTNFQANVVDTGPGALRGYLANVEKVTLNGVELDFTTRRIGGFSFYGNLAYTDAHYDSFANGPCPIERIGTATAACDLSGKELPGVSKWAGSFGGEYRQDVSIGRLTGEGYVGADASFRSAYYADAAVSEYARLPAYELLNLRLGFSSDAGWEAFVLVKNALDEEYIQNITVVSGNSGLIVGTPGEDRTVSLTLRARY
ncbi:TonB-dependent receptor [Caulobacter sp. SLTY]|uniref:TonB-dependent receptor n=1 Tax=Caulobacter sp. SLTY TaxID=2683262 RepID=UPI001412A91D|nr:TonB-dependent receptor [Caulobacter sp. SLTY]NBB15550.1 TonB-dependent receptor [Caulobacter sp. SLTY]